MKRNAVFTVLILAAALTVVMAPLALAQQYTPPSPQERVDQISQAVTLSTEQKAKILKIYQDADANRGGGGGGGRGGFFGGATTEAVEKVLTPEQVTKWHAYTLKQSVDRRMNQIDEAVKLTDDQKKKLTPVLEKEISEQTKMMTEMRAQGENADREAMRDKMTALREATDKAMATILTKDQLTKYNNMPRRGFGGGRRN